MKEPRTLTVQAKKYDGRVRKTWSGALLSQAEGRIVLVAHFEEEVSHNDLGIIKAGTVSFEHFWFDRWYNIFRFHEPDGGLLAHYINIAMPADLEGNTLSYVDLDIDIIRWADGRVDVLDRDDFEKNQQKYGYTSEVIDKVELTVADVLGVIHGGGLP